MTYSSPCGRANGFIKVRMIFMLSLFICIGIVSGDFCVEEPFNENNECYTDTEDGKCGEDHVELFRDIVNDQNGTVTEVVCCKPGTNEEKHYRRVAMNCQTTVCLSSTSQDICSPLHDRYINGSKVEYEEVLRESCNLGGAHPPGVVGLCCQPNSTESLLVSTLGAEDHEFPHQAKLLPSNCGGNVYNKRFIITAAHCAVDTCTGKILTEERTVILGSNIAGVENKEFVYKVKQVIPYPEYGYLATSKERKAKEPDERRWLNDIALLELERDIQFGNNIKALEIAPKDFDPFKWADKALIVGWGTTDTLEMADNLQKANFILRRDSLCFGENASHAEYGGKEQQLLCVGGVLEGKWSPTAGAGDSGGPAVCRNENGKPVLCGVTSFGGEDDECQQNSDEKSCLSSVYTEVAHFHDWLVKTAGQQDPKTLYQPDLYGKKVTTGEYEHQVRITTKSGKSCGGTLIEPDVVVTAAHCVFAGNGTNFTMENGISITSGINTLLNKTGTTFMAKSAKHLPGFKLIGIPGKNSLVDVAKQGEQVVIRDNFYQNDLAVVLLNGKVNISPDKLAVVPKSGESFAKGVELAFLRETEHGGQLMSRNYNLMDSFECQKRADRLAKANLNIKVDSNILCGVEKYSGGSTCDRELGGGLICKGKNNVDVLCGVQNFRLCMYSLPNGFVNMALYAEWVEKTINQMRK